MNVIKRHFTPLPKGRDVKNHSPLLIDGMRFSTAEFYQRIEAALQAQQVPELVVSHVDLKEGGPLSPRRDYLRLRRERLLLDICAMPYGTGFFVSEWFWEQPQKLGLAALLMALAILSLLGGVTAMMVEPVDVYLRRTYHMGYSNINHISWMMIVAPILLAIAAKIWFGESLDALLIRIPLIGYLYERFLRKITYYRVDRACAFRTAIHGAVGQVVNELCKIQGIPPPSEFSQRPENQELQSGIDRPKDP